MRNAIMYHTFIQTCASAINYMTQSPHTEAPHHNTISFATMHVI